MKSQKQRRNGEKIVKYDGSEKEELEKVMK